MNPQPIKTDRYITFAGMDCDQRAEQLITRIHQRLRDLGEASPWSGYFTAKLAESERRGHDALHFVGSQVNALRDLFASSPNPTDMELLEGLEEECC